MDNQTVGRRGEDHICAILEGIARECGGKLLRNLYIPTGGGHTAEVDAVLLTRKGAFVVEIKSWQGHIRCGNARYNEWSVRPWHKLKAKPEKRFSPIKQNAKHVEAVAKLARTSPSEFTSLIVFTSNAELKKLPPNTDSIIVREDGLRSAVKTRLRGRRDRLTSGELEALCEVLGKTQGASNARRRTHVSQAKQAERRRLEAREKRRKADRKRRARKKAQAKAKARKALLMQCVLWAGLGCLLLAR